MKAVVKEIQINGGLIVSDLDSAVKRLSYEGPQKIHFCIEMPDGSLKGISFRQEGQEVLAYGDFEGLPDFIDVVEAVSGKTLRRDRSKITTVKAKVNGKDS